MFETGKHPILYALATWWHLNEQPELWNNNLLQEN